MEAVDTRKWKQNNGIFAWNIRTGRIWFLLMGWIVILWWLPAGTFAMDPATSNALKVQHILKTIAAKKKKPGSPPSQKAVITGNELNAYIAWRLSMEKDPIIRNLTVSLLDNNRVRGKIRFDLSGMSLLALLGSDMSFDFDGTLQTKDGGGRIVLASLSLNGQAVPPQTLDAVLVAVARYYGEAPGSINDWYELPEGVDHIVVSPGRARLHY